MPFVAGDCGVRARDATLPLIAMIAFAATAGRASEQPPQFYCRSEAVGKGKSSVEVISYVEASGNLVGRHAYWTPPHTTKGRTAFGKPSLELVMYYDDPTPERIGKIGDAYVSITVFDPEHDRDWLARRYIDLTMKAAIGGKLESVPFTELSLGPSLDHFLALNAKLDPAYLNDAKSLNISAVDSAGRTLLSDKYDLSALEDRNRLFGQAWRAAISKAMNPTLCDPTAAGPPFKLEEPESIAY